MKTAERPDVAIETTAESLAIVVQGEEAAAVLALAASARRYDPENTRRLRNARDLALYVKRTGHLPAELEP